MRRPAALVAISIAIVALVGCVAVLSSQEDQANVLVPLDLHWHPALDTETSRYFENLPAQLQQDSARKQQLAQQQKLARATDVLQVAPPRTKNAKAVIHPYEGQELASAPANWAKGDDSAMYNLAENHLKDDFGPLSREAKTTPNVVSVRALEAKLASDKQRMLSDEKALSHVSSHLSSAEQQSLSDSSSFDNAQPDGNSPIVPDSSASPDDDGNSPMPAANSNRGGDLPIDAQSQKQSLSQSDSPPDGDSPMPSASASSNRDDDGYSPMPSSASNRNDGDLPIDAQSKKQSLVAVGDGKIQRMSKNKGKKDDAGMRKFKKHQSARAHARQIRHTPGARMPLHPSISGDSEIQKTAKLIHSVRKLLGKHRGGSGSGNADGLSNLANNNYHRPVSTALVARELGDAIDKHERCRRKLAVAEHHLMAVEEKAKVAMAEARSADDGMAKALAMTRKAEDLVEKAREEHENYVKDVRDSLDVRSQYTTEALQAHTLLEHMTRLKNRYDAAVKALTLDQVKYNKLLRKVEVDTDKKSGLKLAVADERAELAALSGSNDDNGGDDDGVTLDEKGNAREQELAENPFKQAAEIMSGTEDADDGGAGNRAEKDKLRRLGRMQMRAQQLVQKANKVFSSLPAIEEEARKEKKLAHRDHQLLVETQNDRILLKNRMDEGEMSKARAQSLGELVEQDSRRIDKLQLGYETATRRLRAARKAEALGPELAHAARSAESSARRAASNSAGQQFQHGFGAFSLGAVLAHGLNPDLATKVAAQVMSMAGNNQELRAREAKNSQMLAAATGSLTDLREQARQLRSEMKIKRNIANDARKDYTRARNRYEHAARRANPLGLELHDRSKGILASRQEAEKALQKAQQHLVNTRRTSRFAASAKRDAGRYLRRVRTSLYEKQEVVKNLARCQRGAWFQIKDITDTAKLHGVIGDGESTMDWNSPRDLMNSAA